MKTDGGQYFYTTPSGRGGPVGFAELRSLAAAGKITRSDKIWCEGMTAWETAAGIQGLFIGLPPDLFDESASKSAPAWPARRNNETSELCGGLKPVGMIQCRQCGQLVSAAAKTCVKCGVPSPASGDYIDIRSGGFWIGKALAIVGGAILIWWPFHSWGDLSNGARAILTKSLLLGGGAGLAFLFWNGRGENPLNKKPAQETPGASAEALANRTNPEKPS